MMSGNCAIDRPAVTSTSISANSSRRSFSKRGW